MAKRADVELRIRSKNLAGKELRDVNDELEKLVANQKKQANAADLASKSLRQLNEEQRDLSKIAAELSRRRSLVESLIGKQSELVAARTNLNRVRQELAELLLQKSKGTFLGDIDKAIRNVKSELVSAEKAFNRTNGGVEKLDTSLRSMGVGTEDLSASLRQVDAMLDRANAGIVEQTAQINGYTQAQEKAAAAARRLAQQQEAVAAARTQGIEDRFNAVMARRQVDDAHAEAIALDRIIGINQRYAAVLDRVAQAQQKAAQAAKSEQAAAGASAAQREAAAAARIAGINERFAAVMDRRSVAQDRAARAADRDRQALDANGRAAARTASSLDRYNQVLRQGTVAGNLFADTGRKSLSVYQRLRGEVLSLAAAYLGVYQAVNLLTMAVQTDQRRQAINTQINLANNGDELRTANDLRFLREEADRLGLTFEQLAKNYANYKISARAAGATNKQVRTSFVQASEVVTGLRLSAEDADGVFRAFVQIMSKARVQAEELRGQLGDRLPGAVAEFAKANNIALSDLDEYLKKGKGNVQNFLNFLQGYSQKVQGAVAANSKTLQADVNRLKNIFGDFLQSLSRSGASAELQRTIKALSTALSGDEGAKFAQQLSDAFAAVLKVLTFVIENFDTFLTLIKAFIALQAAKAVYGLSLSFVQLGKGLVGTMKSLIGLPAALRASAAAGSLFAGSMLRVGTVLMGPVGIALAGLAAVFYGIARAENKAAQEADNYSAAIGRTLKAQGEQARGAAKARAAEAKAMNSELRELIDRREKMVARSQKPGGSILNSFEKIDDAFRDPENVQNIDNINARIALLKERLEGTATAAQVAAKRYIEFRKSQAEIDAQDNAEQSNFQIETPEEDDKSGEDAAAKAERLAERRRDLADRAAKELIDIEKGLSDAMLETEITAQEQIKANLAERLKIIDAEIEKKRIDLESLRRDAAAAGATEGVNSANQALKLIDSLKQVQVEKAKEKALTDQVALAEKKVNDLIAERDAKIAASNALAEAGLKTEVQARSDALAIQKEYSGQIAADIDALVALLQTLPPDVFARLGGAKLLAELEAIRIKATQVKTQFQLIGEELGGQFAAGAADAFAVLAQGIAGFLQGANSIGDAFKAASQAFLSFLADFLVGIGKAIIQAIILQAIMNMISGGSGGYAQAAMGAIGGVQNHDGGIVGQDGKSRWIPLSAMANAQRFHDGGLPGLKSNEVPTILEKGEEVLTADNPRHMNNAGGGQNTTIINSIDSPSVVEAGLPSKSGTQVLLNTIKANKQAIRTALGF